MKEGGEQSVRKARAKNFMATPILLTTHANFNAATPILGVQY